MQKERKSNIIENSYLNSIDDLAEFEFKND